jgi:hypothetical protein
LSQRLQESVAPLFIIDRGKPDRIGSCVLVRLDSEFYAFTAAHVIRDAGSATLFAPSEGRGGKLQPLPPYTAHLKSSGGANDLDVAVLALAARHLGPSSTMSFWLAQCRGSRSHQQTSRPRIWQRCAAPPPQRPVRDGHGYDDLARHLPPRDRSSHLDRCLPAS